MPGSCLASAQVLRKAGSSSDSSFSLFLRAASSTAESNKDFIKDDVLFILKQIEVGVVLRFGFSSQDAFEKVPPLKVAQDPSSSSLWFKVFSSIGMLSSF